MALHLTDSQRHTIHRSDLESLMQTLSGGSLTAPEAKKRTVLDKIDKQAEEYENNRCGRSDLVELKAESVEDYSDHCIKRILLAL